MRRHNTKVITVKKQDNQASSSVLTGNKFAWKFPKDIKIKLYQAAWQHWNARNFNFKICLYTPNSNTYVYI